VPNPNSRSPRRRRARGRGQALTEFALVIPIFLLVLSGILDFGFMLYSRMTVINAAREGARAAVMAPVKSTIPTVVQGRVVSAATGSGLTMANLVVTTACDRTSGTACTFTTNTPAQPADAKAGDSVKVTVDYSYTSFFPLLFGSHFHLVSTVQMVLE
jgi:Flp pilus assembly protein TadG